MKKLHELLNKAKPVAGDFGVEIEVEGNNLPHVEGGGWKCERDGSLRGESMEYIFAKPVAHDKVKGMIEYLSEAFKENGSKLDFSFRTSVHVHMNVQELTANQVLNVIYTYLLLEEPLVNYVGKERKGNRFCLRLQDAEGLLDSLNNMFLYGDEYLTNVPHDSARYASINVEAMQKYGSIEFRAMRGNCDAEFISNWTAALYNIRAFATEMAEPFAVYQLYQELGAQKFFTKVLGKAGEVIKYPRMQKDIERSFSLSLDLPFTYKQGIVIREEREKMAKAMAEEEAKRPKRKVAPGVDFVPEQYDTNENEIRIGDRIRITKKVADYEMGWTAQMSLFVGDGMDYIVTAVRENCIKLSGGAGEYVWPNKAITVRRRGQPLEE